MLFVLEGTQEKEWSKGTIVRSSATVDRKGAADLSFSIRFDGFDKTYGPYKLSCNSLRAVERAAVAEPAQAARSSPRLHPQSPPPLSPPPSPGGPSDSFPPPSLSSLAGPSAVTSLAPMPQSIQRDMPLPSVPPLYNLLPDSLLTLTGVSPSTAGHATPAAIFSHYTDKELDASEAMRCLSTSVAGPSSVVVAAAEVRGCADVAHFENMESTGSAQQSTATQQTALDAAREAVRGHLPIGEIVSRVRELASRFGTSRPEQGTVRAIRAVLGKLEFPEQYGTDRDAWEAHHARERNFKRWKKAINAVSSRSHV